jgi:nitroreductase
MNVRDAIKQRHSVRRFLNKAVSREQIAQLLETARFSPSGANTQPWQVAVLTGEAKQQLSDAILTAFSNGEKAAPDYEYYPVEWTEPYLGRRRACGLQLYQSLGIDRKDKEAQRAQWAANYRGFDAPVMLLFWMDGVMQTGSFIDFGMFLQSFMISAVEAGLATCPQAAMAEYPQIIKPMLGVPDDAILLCGIALGYEDTQAPINQYRTAREAVNDFTRFYDSPGDFMSLQDFITQLKTAPDSVEFDNTMAIIDANYDFTPTAFTNGDTVNEAGQNNGSCKILAFGQLNGLSVDETLACFGKFYRDDVLGNPDGEDHQNIRNFIKSGWEGVSFSGQALSAK